MTDNSKALSPLEALKGGFRRACVRRLVGDEEGAITVLKDEIPKLVVGWAKTTNLDANEKKAKLKELFDDESSRADELATAFDLFAGRFERRVADLVTEEIKKACRRVENVADSLEKLKDEVAQIPVALPEREIVKNIPEPIAEEKTELEIEEVTEQVAIEENNQLLEPEKVQTNKNPDVQEDLTGDDEPIIDDEIEELDEPIGMGLKFDEIEEMIDEVLSMEN